VDASCDTLWDDANSCFLCIHIGPLYGHGDVLGVRGFEASSAGDEPVRIRHDSRSHAPEGRDLGHLGESHARRAGC
jgi:hypothetical protein